MSEPTKEETGVDVYTTEEEFALYNTYAGPEPIKEKEIEPNE